MVRNRNITNRKLQSLLKSRARGRRRHKQSPLTSWKVRGIFTEWSGFEGTPGSHLGPPPAQPGPPRTGCPGPCPAVFWRFCFIYFSLAWEGLRKKSQRCTKPNSVTFWACSGISRVTCMCSALKPCAIAPHKLQPPSILYGHCRRQLKVNPEVQLATHVLGSQPLRVPPPAVRRAYCYLFSLQVERHLTEGLHDALKKPSTALGQNYYSWAA